MDGRHFSQPIPIPVRAGRLAMGTDPAIIVKIPFWIPDAPRPATARPTISIFEDEAKPQIKEPTSKMAKKTRKVL